MTIDQLKHDLKLHPACYHLTETSDAYQVYLPTGYRKDRINCGKKAGRAAALRVLAHRCEVEYQHMLKGITI